MQISLGFKVNSRVFAFSKTAMAGVYKVLQVSAPHFTIELLDDGKVSASGGSPHGSWNMKCNQLFIWFHFKNEESKVKLAVLKRVEGTCVWEKINDDANYKFFMAPLAKRLQAEVDAPPAESLDCQAKVGAPPAERLDCQAQVDAEVDAAESLDCQAKVDAEVDAPPDESLDFCLVDAPAAEVDAPPAERLDCQAKVDALPAESRDCQAGVDAPR